MNILACGALAEELLALKKINRWDDLVVRCLPAHYHQTPEKIPAAVASAIEQLREQDSEAEILVAYGDCGTGGKLDEVLGRYGVERLPGAHCYEFFSSPGVFEAMQEAEVGTFYLTDFLVRHFDTYVIRALGLDRKPELLPVYFGNYRRLMYLAQTRSEALVDQARAHADRLELEFDWHYTGYGALGDAMASGSRSQVAVACPT